MMCKSLTIHFGISRARVHFMPSLCLFMQHQTVRRKLVSCCCCCFLSLLVLGPSILQSAAAWNNHRLSMTTTRRTVLQKLILASPFSTLVNVTPSFARNLPEPTTADLSRTGTVEALVPVLRLQDSLSSVELYLSEPGASISGIDSFLKSVPRDETTFKSIFDQYSDPISYKQKFVDQNAFLVYYTKGFDGPGRPSIESDLPVKQTVQYGARNDAWVAYDDFRAELDFQKTNATTNVGDLLPPLRQTLAAIKSYLAQAPQADQDAAQTLIEKLSKVKPGTI